MGIGVGYFIELPNEPSLYLTGDTVLTNVIKIEVQKMNADYSVVVAGGAHILGQPILMTPDEIRQFIRLTKGKVILDHLEIYHYCYTSKNELNQMIIQENWDNKVFIAEDGNAIVL